MDRRSCWCLMRTSICLWVLLFLGLTIYLPAKDDRKRKDYYDWKPLFDGKKNQFRGYKLFDFPKRSWRIDEGALRTIPGADAIDLISEERYDNFELELDWITSPGARTGVLYRAAEDDEGPAWFSGPIVSLMDDESHPDAEHFNRTTGAIYDVAGPRASKTLNPPGQWNQLRLVMHGTQVEHWINGSNVLAYDLSSEQFRRLVGRSQFRALKGFAHELEGHVVLQYSSDVVWFRNVRIRRLP